MARSAATRADQAAEAIEAFLRNRPHPGPGGTGIMAAGSSATAAFHHARPPRPQHEASPASPDGVPPGAPLRLPHTDWLRHRLTVTGPPLDLDAFRRTASGTGTIPWQLQLDSLEEDWFHLLASPAHRVLSLAGARVLAGQLRDAVERRQAVAVARVGHGRTCPFDLHALVPVPAPILHLGPDHPDTLAWLWQHWGTTEALRHVTPEKPERAVPGQEVAGGGVLRLGFWSADWTPWRAFERIRADWPALRFVVQPDYAAA